ncbi:hypothetical protein JCM10212_007000 [Sporobolomyces blumeae]
MNDSSPPRYSTEPTSDTASSSVLLNLAPLPNSTTFQLGYLGHGPAFIAGDVQVKHDQGARRDGIAEPRPRFDRLVVRFRGIERVEAADPIVLCNQVKVLWGTGAAGTSSATSSSSSSHRSDPSFPPATCPFKLEITPDLPVCLHLGTSALEYTLTAELYYSDPAVPPVARCAPVHLTRTSAPGSVGQSSDQPDAATTSREGSTATPIPFSVRLSRSTFEQGQAVELVAKIPVPSASVVGDGLRLRTVSAELVRTIRVNPVLATSRSRNLDDEGAHRHGGEDADRSVQKTVLAHSGKSARFSPARPIVIRLLLHPPAEIPCESITQSTILHSVSFSVVVTIGLFKLGSSRTASSSSSGLPPASTATSLDAVLPLPVSIVPPSSRVASRALDKQREAEDGQPRAQSPLPPPPPPLEGVEWPPPEHHIEAGDGGPVPTYVEYSADDPGIPAAASSSSVPSVPALPGVSSWNAPAAQLFEEWSREQDRVRDDEEEYDGYEEMSIPGQDEGPPPPAIDEDVSPPSAGEAGSTPPVNLLTSVAAHEDVSPLEGPVAYAQAVLSSPSPSPPSSPPPPLSPLNSTFPLGSVSPLPDQPRHSQASPPPPPVQSGDDPLPPPYIAPPPLVTESDPSTPPSNSVPHLGRVLEPFPDAPSYTSRAPRSDPTTLPQRAPLSPTANPCTSRRGTALPPPPLTPPPSLTRHPAALDSRAARQPLQRVPTANDHEPHSDLETARGDRNPLARNGSAESSTSLRDPPPYEHME